MANAIYINENSHEQTINVVVRDGERGPRGEDGRDGKDGAIQYQAGPGITIQNNTISATGGGGGGGSWGSITGNIQDQTDLQNEFANYPIITVTNVDPGTGVSLEPNHFIGVFGPALDPNYSTYSRSTGAWWIDGKTIYKKTVAFAQLGNPTATIPETAVFAGHGITNLDKVINIEGYFKDSVTGEFFGVQSPDTGNSSWIRTTVDSTYVTVETGSDRSSCSGYVTIYYTLNN